MAINLIFLPKKNAVLIELGLVHGVMPLLQVKKHTADK